MFPRLTLATTVCLFPDICIVSFFSARYFDIESIKDKESPLPHMLPSATQFASQVGALGISNEDHVVVYDTVGFMSAPRVYWMFKVKKMDNPLLGG